MAATPKGTTDALSRLEPPPNRKGAIIPATASTVAAQNAHNPRRSVVVSGSAEVCGEDTVRPSLGPRAVYLLRGRPRTRSARMLRRTSEEPASIVFALERRNWYTHPSPSPTWPAGPAISTAVSVIRWLSSDHISLRIDPSGPGIPFRFTAVTAR